jgi:YD repeat-containing protein
VVLFNDKGVMQKFENVDIQRDDQGHLLALRQGDKAVVTFRYGDAGRVVKFTTAEGYGGDFYYNEKGWQTSHKNAWNCTYGFNYNTAGSLAGAIWPDGSRITTFYDPKTANVTSFIDRQGEMESYTVLQGAPDQKSHAKPHAKRQEQENVRHDLQLPIQHPGFAYERKSHEA